MKNLLILFLLFSLACSNKMYQQKIKFKLDNIDEQGIRKGVSVSYEFCIPKSTSYQGIVLAIDPEVKFHAQAKGRIGCTKDEVLCISHTHQKEYKSILKNLSKQDFIDEIRECFFE